jgi:hypothetical protein
LHKQNLWEKDNALFAVVILDRPHPFSRQLDEPGFTCHTESRKTKRYAMKVLPQLSGGELEPSKTMTIKRGPVLLSFSLYRTDVKHLEGGIPRYVGSSQLKGHR